MKSIFDMEPEMEGDEEPESPVKVPTKADDAEDEDAPFMPTSDKNLQGALNSPPKQRTPWDPTAPIDPEETKRLMQKINSISGQGQATNVTKVKQTIKTSKSVLKQALEILRDSESWLPEGKKQVSPQLDKVGKTIANALESYVAHLEKME